MTILSTRIVLGERAFARFAATISKPFKPNAALLQALKEARRKVRRARGAHARHRSA